MTPTKQQIIDSLATNDAAVKKALLILLERQTNDEQYAETTRHENDRGFNKAHGKMGTSMAKQLKRTGDLSEKQIRWWRVRPDGKRMRIAIYWRQLQEHAYRTKYKKMTQGA